MTLRRQQAVIGNSWVFPPLRDSSPARNRVHKSKCFRPAVARAGVDVAPGRSHNGGHTPKETHLGTGG